MYLTSHVCRLSTEILHGTLLSVIPLNKLAVGGGCGQRYGRQEKIAL